MTIADLALSFMVPMAIQDLLLLPEGEREAKRRAWTAAAVADVIAGSGDMILHGAAKPTKPMQREAAAATTAAAKAIAALAFLPGGVTMFGSNWCARHAPVGRRSAGGPCVSCLAEVKT